MSHDEQFPQDAMIRARHEAVSRSRVFSRICDRYGLRQKSVLDIGCGYGEYLASFGSGSVGITTTKAEVEYGGRANLAIRQGNAEALDEIGLGKSFEVAWANNLYEHLLSPHAFLIFLKTIVGKDGIIILGVPMVPRIVSLLRLGKFRGALASNHINFFTRDTLRLTVERAGWVVEDVRPFIFHSRLLDNLVAPFAPHLYAVARNDAGFTYPQKKLNEWVDDPRYERLLAIGRRS